MCASGRPGEVIFRKTTIAQAQRSVRRVQQHGRAKPERFMDALNIIDGRRSLAPHWYLHDRVTGWGYQVKTRCNYRCRGNDAAVQGDGPFEGIHRNHHWPPQYPGLAHISVVA